MSYSPTTDFFALVRQTSGGEEFASMPGLDMVVAALMRAGLVTLVVGQTAPIVNQPSTAWFKPSVPSWVAEGVLFLWNTTTQQYETATPQLWTNILTLHASFVAAAATSDPLSVKATGALGDGVTDDTFAIQTALNTSKNVFVPVGTYIVSATLQMQPAGAIRGSNRDTVQIRRSTAYGPTLQCGSTVIGVNAGSCTVENLWFFQVTQFNNGPSYVAGVSTVILNKETNPHVAIYKGQNVLLNGLRATGAGGISIYGCTAAFCDSLFVNGCWDDNQVGLQECFANIGFYQFTDANNNVSFNTECRVRRCYLGGFGHTPNQNVTIGNVVISLPGNFGSASGIYCNASEGFEVHDSYIGGNNRNNIMLDRQGIFGLVRIHHNFFDSARTGSIKIQASAAGGGPSIVEIDHNVSQGYGFDQSFLVVADLGIGEPACANLDISNNIGQGYNQCAVSLSGVRGFSHSNNQWRDYNKWGNTNNDPAINSGLYALNCTMGDSSNNCYGGGTNDPSGANTCQYGSTFVNPTTCTASHENGQNLGLIVLGLSGYESNLDQWIAYTPTVSSQTGAYGAASATGFYRVDSNTVHVHYHVTVTGVGTATTASLITLPLTAVVPVQTGSARDETAGFQLISYCSDQVHLFHQKYDATFPPGSYSGSFTYEKIS